MFTLKCSKAYFWQCSLWSIRKHTLGNVTFEVFESILLAMFTLKYSKAYFWQCVLWSIRKHTFDNDLQKGNIWHWDPNSFFRFDDSLLDAESSLEDVLDTNITSFLRRFWIRYQNGITSDLQKVTFLVLQVVLFFKNSPRRAAYTMKLMFSFFGESSH